MDKLELTEKMPTINEVRGAHDHNRVLVSVRCLVYNQEKYIRQCLEGIVMQRTSFPFEAIVHDDASTDGTAEIIKDFAQKYPQIIKPILETENQYSKHDGSIRRIMNAACKGKYIAYCEGDDYWTDPGKLQKQVDILEADPRTMMVYTGFETVDEEGTPLCRPDFDYNMKTSPTGFALPAFLYRNVVMTVSSVFRREVFECAYKEGTSIGLDYLTFLCAAALGRVVYLKEKTCCYRKVSSSLTNSNMKGIRKEVLDVLDYMTGVYEDGLIPMNGTCHFKTRLHIMARGWDLYLKGLDKPFFKKHCLGKRMLPYLLPGLLLELYLQAKFHFHKMRTSHE